MCSPFALYGSQASRRIINDIAPHLRDTPLQFGGYLCVVLIEVGVKVKAFFMKGFLPVFQVVDEEINHPLVVFQEPKTEGQRQLDRQTQHDSSYGDVGVAQQVDGTRMTFC